MRSARSIYRTIGNGLSLAIEALRPLKPNFNKKHRKNGEKMPRRTKEVPRPIEIKKSATKVHPKFNLSNDPDFLALNPRRQRFVYNVFMQPATGWTNANCYREAFGKDLITKGHTPKADSVQYHKLIRDPKISPLIRKIQIQYAKTLDVTPTRILQEEACIAFSDIAQYFDAEGHLTIHPRELPEHARRAIKSIKAIHLKNGSTVYEVSLWSKSTSLQRLQNVLGLNPVKKVEVSGPDGQPIQVNHKYDFTLLGYEEKRQLTQLLNKCRIENNDDVIEAIPYNPT